MQKSPSPFTTYQWEMLLYKNWLMWRIGNSFLFIQTRSWLQGRWLESSWRHLEENPWSQNVNFSFLSIYGNKKRSDMSGWFLFIAPINLSLWISIHCSHEHGWLIKRSLWDVNKSGWKKDLGWRHTMKIMYYIGFNL